MVVVMYFAPALLLAEATAQAAPIVDPRAPVSFQPTITQTSTGVPAVNIAAPNANGLSANQYSSFNVDSSGLVLNNSLVSGTPLLGGTLGANPNLNGRAATTILNQVTSTASSTLAGPLEVFGSPASIIISNPNGLSVNGLSLTNAPGLVLTTGVPQFIAGPGGSATSFANAGAVAYSVSSGNVTIDGPAGANGPGSGIEGTVGNIDIISQSVSLNAPLHANQAVNVIAGSQTVTPGTTGSSSTSYATSNIAGGTPGAVAVDASQYGSVTAGQIYIVSTAAGEGVNMQGPLAATAGNLSVNSNGDITVGQTFANQNVSLTSAGKVTISNTGLANQNYTVNATGDINATGSVSAGQDIALTASNNLNAATVAANGQASLVAGNSMTLGSLAANAINLRAETGDLTVNSALAAPGTIAAVAGRDLTINGAVQGGSTVALTGARSATINGSVAAVGDTTITARTGSASVSGNVQSNGAFTTTAAQDVALGGTVQAQGPVSVTATNGSITGQGNVASSNDAVSLTAGQNVQAGGNLQAGTDLSVSAGADAMLGGTATAPGAVTVTAGRDATLAGAATAGMTLAVNAGRNASIDGTVASLGNVALSAGAGTLATTGDVVSLGTLNASGQQGVNLGGTVYSQGNASISSGAGTVTVGGTLSSPGAITVNAAQDATLAGTVHSGGDTAVNAGGNVALNGGLEADGTGNATVTAGGNITGSGAINVANNTTLTAGNSIALTGALQTGNDLSATAVQDISTGAVTAVGNASVTATSGSATLGGDVLTGGNLGVSAGTDVNVPGSVTALGDLNLNAQGGNLMASGPLSAAGNATLNAGRNLALNGQTSVSGNATLTGANITTQDADVGGNLTATATQNLDTSAGTVSVNGTATLAGGTVRTGNTLVGGAYSATGSQTLTTTGTGAYLGDATLAGGTVTTSGTQMAAGTLTVSGSTVTNTGALSGLSAANITAADLINSGTVYGPAMNVSVANSTANIGALMATSALTLTTRALDNSNGVIFAGDVNNPTAATGDVTVNVTGGDGSFSNTNGQILGQNSVTLNLPNQTVDPSSATFGTVNGGNALNLSVAAITNSGTWTLPGTNVTVSASQGMTNSGTIGQAAGSLALDGAVINSGTIAAQDLTVNGNLANQAGATVQAGDAFTLNGSGTNAGTIEALNKLTISGTSYDNSNGITKAGTGAGSGNMAINLSGDLTNSGGTITATNDLALSAANVINSGASGSGATTTTTTVIDNPALLMALVVGSDTLDEATIYGAENGFCCDITSTPQKVTLADALSADGTAAGVTEGVLTLLPGSPPVTTSGTVTFVEVEVPTASGGMQNLWFVQTPDNASQAIATKTIALPTVTETTTTTGGAPGASSVIAAGHDLSLTANSLDNQGGTVSAGHDANINVQSLNNSGSTYSSTVTDGVDLPSLNAFLAAAPSTISIWNNYYGDMAVGPYTVGYYIAPPGIRLDSPGTVTPVSTSSSLTVQGATGQIVAGHNVNLSGGDLTNAGTIAAANDVNITANSFTNQGTNTGTMTTTAGCAAGHSGCTAGATTNNNSQSYSYQQLNANVTAGNDIVVAANAVSNTYGNLVAGRNVVIGGAGTDASDGSGTPTNLTQAASVTNTSGAIAAGNDIDINASSIVNTIAAPVQVHENYGSAKPFAGCSSNCEAYVDVQSASPATITANHDVNLSAGTFANMGSLVTGLNNVTINATTAASSDNQYLNAYWHANLSYYDANFPAWGCAGNSALCASLYGGAYQSAQAQDPAGLPDAAGLPDFVPGTIQAGNTLAVNSPTLTNTGNVIGQTVNLTGSTLVNGLTNPNAYTPPPAVAGQVITLGPPSVPSTATTTVNAAGLVTNLTGQPVSVTGAAGLPSNSPIGVTTVGKPVAPSVGRTSALAGTTVATVGGQTLNVTYLLNSPASAVTGDLSPAALLARLPASLQPDTTQFYYDPYTQAQQVEQAALQATGQSSFYALPAQTDSQTQQTVNNLDTAALYGAALQYAEQNNVALGTQLSQAQLALINAPILWYVEETVPEPGCTATGNGACPTVQALMPEVLLPQNFATVNADGTITGTNVALNYANSILNTGSVSAENLSVNTGSLTNEQRSTNVGNIYAELAGGAGVTDTTGTVVQQGGLMSAANYQLNVDTLNQIGGALQQVNADGSANDAPTAQLLANLKAQLAGNFTQSSVSDNLQTSVVADQGMSVLGTVFMMTVMTVISIGTAGAASAAIGAMAGAAGEAVGSGATFAAAGSGASALGAGVGNVALSAAVGGMVNSAMGQSLSGDGFNLGQMFEAGATAFVTAGLTNGITYANGTLGFTTQASTNSLAALAGVQAVGGVMVPTTTAATGDTLQTVLALAAVTAIQGGTQTAIGGGSFLTNLRNSAVSDVAAAGAFAIGNEFGDQSGFWTTSNPLYAAEHAALGCAASAAEGTGCASGAIGGAVSAGLNPIIDANGNIPPVALTAIETLVSGGIAGALGFNVQGAVTAAQNETLNNWLNHVPPSPMFLSDQQRYDNAVAACGNGDQQACATASALQTQSQQNDAWLANACAGGTGTPACKAAVTAALAGGNNVQFVNGTAYAFDPNGPAIKAVGDPYQTAYANSFDGQVAQSTSDALQFAPIDIPGVAAGLGAIGNVVRSLIGDSGIIDAGIQWGKGIMGQGMPWEHYLAAQLPAESRLPPNFKTFDFYDPLSGVATSAKTLDTTTAARLADPSQVYSSLKSNIDAITNFPGYQLSGVSLTPDMIASSNLQVAVPASTTPAQWQQISNAVQYGASKGVNVKITVTR
ncbi:filamentous hemagglutinin N-terminal domain-containing protein [Paraburkholderia sp. RAU2J]|uniref:endonuclease toxin domain-containing protein n=1 Tax=Paraburkholderia sp. RAU2J TaxID=1938810 RepID=UPI001F540542|nr:filamentous hemagglutinin N-terminal domain-containing protein [Paraburkholderia sp. RAU2J]